MSFLYLKNNQPRNNPLTKETHLGLENFAPYTSEPTDPPGSIDREECRRWAEDLWVTCTEPQMIGVAVPGRSWTPKEQAPEAPPSPRLLPSDSELFRGCTTAGFHPAPPLPVCLLPRYHPSQAAVMPGYSLARSSLHNQTPLCFPRPFLPPWPLLKSHSFLKAQPAAGTDPPRVSSALPPLLG